ncbi:epimerase [Fervidobacterium thailandense]|uniref:Epimerase n=1 Tax=Fervidobacterium thailandense TaxID=1008305 RepID=A0A1E3G0I9_9BACT|nr:epimerase [Fervidobacterium thailandense]
MLVTGATGHLGNVLCKVLLERGYGVKALIEPGTSTLPLEGLATENVFRDIRDDFKDLTADVDAIIHLASVISITPKNKKRVYSVNVEGTKNILNQAKSRGCPFIYASSVHVFVDKAPGSVYTEDDEINEEKVHGHYAKSKAIATKLVLDAFRQGLDGFVFFPTGIHGPFDYRLSHFSRVLINFKSGKLRYTVPGSFDFVDVRDCAKAVADLLELLFSGKINKDSFIISGWMVDFSKLPILCGSKPFKVLSWSAAEIFSYVGLILNTLGIDTEFVPYAIHNLKMAYRYSRKKLESFVSYSPRTVQESINDFFTWLESANPMRN